MLAVRSIRVLKGGAKKTAREFKGAPLRKLAGRDAVLTKVNGVVDLLRRHLTESNAVAWKVGKLLVEIRDMVDDSMWMSILNNHLNEALGAASRSKNWLYQAISLYNMFPKNPERAAKIGIGKMQRILRIKDPIVRRAVLKRGITTTPAPVRKAHNRNYPLPTPTLKSVESLSTRQLGREVNRLTGQVSADDRGVSTLSRLITSAVVAYAERQGRDVGDLVPAVISPKRMNKAVLAFLRELNRG